MEHPLKKKKRAKTVRSHANTHSFFKSNAEATSGGINRSKSEKNRNVYVSIIND